MGAELEDQVSLGTEAAILRPECKGAREPGCTGKGDRATPELHRGRHPRRGDRMGQEDRRGTLPGDLSFEAASVSCISLL